MEAKFWVTRSGLTRIRHSIISYSLQPRFHQYDKLEAIHWLYMSEHKSGLALWELLKYRESQPNVLGIN
jgi:hypothetical protein